MKTKKPAIITKGYKVTDQNMQCLNFQYELNKVFTHKGDIEICDRGFHFCKIANDCFNYYSFTSKNRVFEVEAYGELQEREDKSCAGSIKLIRELTWVEVLNIVNTGKDNRGRGNTGNRNTGNRNTGDRNTGYSNTGYRNTGDRNTGYSNTGDRNTGLFCTEDAPFPMFNKPSNWTEEDFINSRAYYLMRNYVDTKQWIPEYQMSDEEKQKYPSYKTAEGYLKDIPFKEAFTNAWHNWSEENRKAFTSLENFDAKIFEEITGVKI